MDPLVVRGPLFRGVSLLAMLMASLLFQGCAEGLIPVNYSPGSVKSASGALSVAEFKYLPSMPTAQDPIPSNLIMNTAMGEVTIDRDVKTFVRDAIFAELRFVGIRMNGKSKVLTGDIEEFVMDDLGFSTDWTLRIHYHVHATATNREVYQSVKTVRRNTAKFINVFGALNETIRQNAEQLIDDPEFIKAINQ